MVSGDLKIGNVLFLCGVLKMIQLLFQDRKVQIHCERFEKLENSGK